MDLILWRHAEAQEAEDGMDDLARQLTPKGRKQARRMAQWLETVLPNSCRILVSPSRRTIQTAEALGRRYRICDEIAPSADADTLLRAANWPHGATPVLLVGHQPALGAAAAQLLTGQAGQMSIRKGAVWWISAREDDRDCVLRAVSSPDLVRADSMRK